MTTSSEDRDPPLSKLANKWGRSVKRVVLATSVPGWRPAAIGLVLLGALALFGLYTALLLVAAFVVCELLVMGWSARRARLRCASATPAPWAAWADDPEPRALGPGALAADRRRDERPELQRWEDEGGAMRPVSEGAQDPKTCDRILREALTSVSAQAEPQR